MALQPPRPSSSGQAGSGRIDDDLIVDLRESTTGLIDPTPTSSGKPKPASGRPRGLKATQSLIRLTHEGPLWEAAEKFVYNTYRAAGYCAPSPRDRVEELQIWNELSRFHVVVDDGEVVGTLRVILGPYGDLPAGQFARTDFSDIDPMAELSSMAVDPASRGLDVVVHLCRAAFVEAFRDGASALVFVVDDWMIDLLVETYRLPIRPVGVQRRYMGGDVTPSAMTLHGPNFLSTARENPDYWQWMTEAFTPAEIVGWKLPIVLTDHAPGRPPAADPRVYASAGTSATRSTEAIRDEGPTKREDRQSPPARDRGLPPT